MRRRSRELGREAGQATIEYMLLLIVTVMIILGVLYRFNMSFRAYADAYFGDYVACLLEAGELPGLAQECATYEPTYDPNSGKYLVKGSFPNGSTGGGTGNPPGSGSGSDNAGGDGSSGGKDGKGSDKEDGRKSADAAGGSQDEVVAGAAASGGGGSGAVGRVNKWGRDRVTSVGDSEDTGKAAQTNEGGAGNLLGVSPTSSNAGNYEGGRSRRLENMTWGYAGEEEAKERAKSRPPVATVSKTSTGNETLKPKKAVEKINREPANKKDVNGDGFSFGKLIQILLIAAIIVAIIVFFGGQLLQITKSWEK